MKKALILIAILIVILPIDKPADVIIPKNSIRFRVIANSDDKNDQDLKKKVVNNLKPEISAIKYTPKNIVSTRESIHELMPRFGNVVQNTLLENNSKMNYSIDYGINYFPEKKYKGVTYEEGNYESLIITLGDGLGKNFWCVLFPPLCLVEAEEDTKIEDVKYTSIIKEIIDKYF